MTCGGLGRNILDRVAEFVQQNIPDPRNDPMAQRPVGYENYKKMGITEQANTPETMEDYLKQRHEKWTKSNLPEASALSQAGIKTREDGSLFLTGNDTKRDMYQTVEAQNQELAKVKVTSSEVDDEKQKLRRQLQLENEQEFRKFMAEARRTELTEQAAAKRRMPHPADPKYDPFRATPGYRPQDSSKLASWLDQQRKSGKAYSGARLATPEGQERWYNEEKMATQYHANPFANRVEIPPMLPKVELTGMSPDSFFVKDQEIIGSILCTPTRVYHWNASVFEDINKRTLSAILHLYPVPDVCFIGTGRNLYHIDEELRIEFQKRGTVVHCLTTKDACSNFTMQLTHRRRMCLAALSCIPTNPYGKECFGDFIENDAFCLSDTALGIRAPRQFNPYLYKVNKVAEKYRHMQGTGYGPRYMQLPDGRLVRPGTHGTKLRPMLEPNEEPEWDKLPSYYNWFPKERMEDYVENTTYREIQQGAANRKEADLARVTHLHSEHQEVHTADELPQADLKPWDSATIPVPKWQYERNEDGVHLVDDPKTGRVVGMNKPTFDKWQRMMKARAEGREPDEEVEYDQERIVAARDGRLMDTSRVRYVPTSEARWHKEKTQSTGRPNQRWG